MTNIAIENHHRNSGFTQLEHGGSFHSFFFFKRLPFRVTPYPTSYQNSPKSGVGTTNFGAWPRQILQLH
jgi:hypothetical protein